MIPDRDVEKGDALLYPLGSERGSKRGENVQWFVCFLLTGVYRTGHDGILVDVYYAAAFGHSGHVVHRHHGEGRIVPELGKYLWYQ